MNTSTVSNIREFHEALYTYRKDTRWKFRGQAESSWSLVPKFGRSDFRHYDEEKLFRQWERGAIQHIDMTRYSVWERLAIAQHHGVPTRLLDWTHNPLIAAFFAVAEHRNTDAAIYAIRVKSRLKDEDFPDPFKVQNTIRYYQPRVSSPRLHRQLGHFTVHGPATLELTPETWKMGDIERIIIAQAFRTELIFDLHHYGVNYYSIFPDLEGLSQHLSWWVRNSQFWTSQHDDEVT